MSYEYLFLFLRYSTLPISILAFKPRDVGLIGEIGWLSTEWSLSFDFICKEYPRDWYMLLLVSHNQGDHSQFGGRVPSIFFHKDHKIRVFSYLNSATNHAFIRYSVNLNQTYSFEFNHRYVANGVYRYTFVVDGEEVFSIPNSPGRQFHNVKFYGANLPSSGSPPAELDVEISNLKYTNFL